MGVSGGEEGRASGPTIMPGGDPTRVDTLSRSWSQISAKAGAEERRALRHLDAARGSAGHFVKMVHNGIEYGDMQLIAECYDLLHRASGSAIDELRRQIFEEWNRGDLGSCS